jgi:hypothetical protein
MLRHIWVNFVCLGENVCLWNELQSTTLEVLGNLFSFDDFLPYRQFLGK